MPCLVLLCFLWLERSASGAAVNWGGQWDLNVNPCRSQAEAKELESLTVWMCCDADRRDDSRQPAGFLSQPITGRQSLPQDPYPPSHSAIDPIVYDSEGRPRSDFPVASSEPEGTAGPSRPWMQPLPEEDIQAEERCVADCSRTDPSSLSVSKCSGNCSKTFSGMHSLDLTGFFCFDSKPGCWQPSTAGVQSS